MTDFASTGTWSRILSTNANKGFFSEGLVETANNCTEGSEIQNKGAQTWSNVTSPIQDMGGKEGRKGRPERSNTRANTHTRTRARPQQTRIREHITAPRTAPGRNAVFGESRFEPQSRNMKVSFGSTEGRLRLSDMNARLSLLGVRHTHAHNSTTSSAWVLLLSNHTY